MRKLLLLFIAAVGLSTCKSDQGRILIKLTKGQQYTQRILTKLTMSTSVNNVEAPTLNIFDAFNKFEVVNVTDSIYVLKVTYVSMSIKVVENGDTVAIKSPRTSVLDSLNGRAYLLKMSNTGSVKSVTGPDSILKALITKLPGMTDAEKTVLKQEMVLSFGNKAIKQHANLGLTLYPSRSVKQGDTWNFKSERGGNILEPKTDEVYKLDKSTGSEYLISGQSKIVMSNRGKNGKVDGPVEIYQTGTMNSRITIDKKNGMIANQVKSGC